MKLLIIFEQILFVEIVNEKGEKMLLKRKKKENKRKELLKFSFINNSILLKTETIERNGFKEIYRQVNEETHSIQILCFNSETEEFQAFDRFKWMNEPRIVIKPPSWYEMEGIKIHCDIVESNGIYYNEDLWTPIKLHYTIEWLENHIIQDV